MTNWYILTSFLNRIEILCHDINVHIPHHISPKIPSYNLRAAHKSLQENWGKVTSIMPISFYASSWNKWGPTLNSKTLPMSELKNTSANYWYLNFLCWKNSIWMRLVGIGDWWRQSWRCVTCTIRSKIMFPSMKLPLKNLVQ